MHIARLLLALAWLPIAAQADFIISAPDTRIAAGKPLELQLTITNDSEEVLIVDVPHPLHVRFQTAIEVATLDMEPDRRGRIEIAPRGFVNVGLKGTTPATVQGVATLIPTGFNANAVTLLIGEAAAQAPGVRANTGRARPPQKHDGSLLVDKPPPLALFVYEPMYLLMGGDDGLNAKFQISFSYRLFDNRGRLARRLPWIDDLYLSYSQTSLWDLNELSKPFKDSSYRPRLSFANYDLARFLNGRLRVGVEAGVGHESNGKEGDDSRSFNMLYMRPAFTLGDVEGLRFHFAPLIHNYIADDENPDLKDYRGYVDWQFGFGSKGGLDFWATARKGERGKYGSLELNASYPLSKLSGGDLTGWLMLQYFGGYGESLLDYREKLDAQLRLGIAVAL